MTYEEIERRKQKGADFVRQVLDDEDHASDLEGESVESYASRKRLVITNRAKRLTNERKSDTTMANGNSDPTKADLQDAIDQASQVLSDAYQPESSREDMASAIGDALDILSGDSGDDDDDAGDDDDDSGGSDDDGV